MDYVGGYGMPNSDMEAPALMFNTGMIVCQTQGQCDLFMNPKNTQVVTSPELSQLDAGDSLNFGGWQ